MDGKEYVNLRVQVAQTLAAFEDLVTPSKRAEPGLVPKVYC